MKKIVIFGSTGNIGSYLTDYCAEHLKGTEYEVVAVGRKNTTFFTDKGIKYCKVDLTDENSFENLPTDDVYAVINLAGLLSSCVSKYDPFDYVNINVTGGLRVLEYARKNGADRMIYMQTWNDQAGYWGKEEVLSPSMPRNLHYTGDHAFYAITKSMIVETMEHYKQEYGLKNFVFRLPNVYMYNPQTEYYVDCKKKIIAYRYMIERAIKGEPIEMWGNPDAFKDILYIKDLCQMIFKALFAEADGGIYNAGTGIKTTLRQQIEGIIDVFSPVDKKSEIIEVPDGPSFTSFVMDIDNIKKDLGYEPEYTYKKYLEDYKIEREAKRFDALWAGKTNGKANLKEKEGKVLVFGATGYVGRYLCTDLKKKGEDVIAFGRNQKVLDFFKEQGIETVDFDITNQDDYKKIPTEDIKAIVNLTVFLPELEGPWQRFFEVNMYGNQSLLEFAHKNGIKRFIMASSHKVYSDINKRIITEKDGPCFIGSHSPYIISKIAAENFMEYYAKDYGMDCIVLRLTGVHGYGSLMGFLSADGSYRKSAAERFMEQAINGEKIEVWGDMNIKRDHVYIKDVVSAFETAINAADGISGIYNVASGVARNQYEDAVAIAKAFAGEKGQSEVVLCPDKPGLTRGYAYSIEKIKRVMGWTPQYADLDKMYEDYKKEWEAGTFHNYHYIKEEDKPITFR